MELQSIARILIAVGAVILVIGGLLLLLAGTPLGETLRNFPGTLRVEGSGFTCLVPVLASILLSIIGSIILNLVIRFFNRP